MRRAIFLILITILILPSCNAPQVDQSTATPTVDAVATQVAVLQTNIPAETAAATTPTVAAATATIPPSATPEQDTATPTSEPATATATVSGELRDTLGTPSWTDSLDSAKAFYLYENDNTRVTHENGTLILTGTAANGWHGWSLTFSRQPQNFYIEAVISTQSCSGSDLYGLVFRAPNTESGYFFGVTCDGRYDLRTMNFADGSETNLLNLSASDKITAGANQTNRLGVMAKGDKIGLYANGSLLTEVTDTTYPDQGYFGAFIAANDTAGFSVKLDEIRLWNLP